MRDVRESNSIEVLSIRDPGKPQHLTRITATADIQDLHIYGNTLYVAAGRTLYAYPLLSVGATP